MNSWQNEGADEGEPNINGPSWYDEYDFGIKEDVVVTSPMVPEVVGSLTNSCVYDPPTGAWNVIDRGNDEDERVGNRIVMKRFKGYVKVGFEAVTLSSTLPICDLEVYCAVVKSNYSHGALFDPNDVFTKANQPPLGNVPLVRNYDRSGTFEILWDYMFKVVSQPAVSNSNVTSSLNTIPNDPPFYTERVQTTITYSRPACYRTVAFDIPMDESTVYLSTSNGDYRDIQSGSLHVIVISNGVSLIGVDCSVFGRLYYDKFL